MITQEPVINEPKVGYNNNRITYIKDYNLSGNALLNKPDFHHTAAIAHRLTFRAEATFDKEKKEIENVNASINGSIWLSDCNRSISLDLDTYAGDKAGENALFKLDTLIDELKLCRKNFKKMLKDKQEHDSSFQETFKGIKLDPYTKDFEEFKREVNS